MTDLIAVAEEVFGDRFVLAQQYHEILASQGIEWGLIGPREVDRLWDRHILNSVALLDVLPVGLGALVDVGSGAGLPGIPVAIARPELEVTLLEPLLRRTNFLRQAVDNLGITDQVTVERGRAEEHKETYDVVTCRAVASLDKLIKWCTPLLAPGGQLIALKGASAQEEVDAATALLEKRRLKAEVLSVRAHPLTDPTSVIRLTRQ